MTDLLKIAQAAKAKSNMTIDELFERPLKDIRNPLPIRVDTRSMPSLADARREYADNLERTVESLTVDERRVAYLNAVIASAENEDG